MFSRRQNLNTEDHVKNQILSLRVSDRQHHDLTNDSSEFNNNMNLSQVLEKLEYPDLLKNLGIELNRFSKGEISKQKYKEYFNKQLREIKKLSLRYHPDKNPNISPEKKKTLETAQSLLNKLQIILPIIDDLVLNVHCNNFGKHKIIYELNMHSCFAYVPLGNVEQENIYNQDILSQVMSIIEDLERVTDDIFCQEHNAFLTLTSVSIKRMATVIEELDSNNPSSIKEANDLLKHKIMRHFKEEKESFQKKKDEKIKKAQQEYKAHKDIEKEIDNHLNTYEDFAMLDQKDNDDLVKICENEILIQEEKPRKKLSLNGNDISNKSNLSQSDIDFNVQKIYENYRNSFIKSLRRYITLHENYCVKYAITDIKTSFFNIRPTGWRELYRIATDWVALVIELVLLASRKSCDNYTTRLQFNSQFIYPGLNDLFEKRLEFYKEENIALKKILKDFENGKEINVEEYKGEYVHGIAQCVKQFNPVQKHLREALRPIEPWTLFKQKFSAPWMFIQQIFSTIKDTLMQLFSLGKKKVDQTSTDQLGSNLAYEDLLKNNYPDFVKARISALRAHIQNNNNIAFTTTYTRRAAEAKIKRTAHFAETHKEQEMMEEAQHKNLISERLISENLLAKEVEESVQQAQQKSGYSNIHQLKLVDEVKEETQERKVFVDTLLKQCSVPELVHCHQIFNNHTIHKSEGLAKMCTVKELDNSLNTIKKDEELAYNNKKEQKSVDVDVTKNEKLTKEDYKNQGAIPKVRIMRENRQSVDSINRNERFLSVITDITVNSVTNEQAFCSK
ncbi:hypothetical protein GUI12_03800 [Anaplasmataceae bacterium AB001_6]|nr:hypothetical protein GUI12_03800 [Anaplasmataceae bacterium AB001_6]